jgi:hypothetical protein
MDTTGMDVKRANKSAMKDTAKGAARWDGTKK